MEALTYIEHGKFALTDKPKPQIINTRDAIVRVTLGSICTIEEAYRIFENHLDGVIKIAVTE